ncbi:amidohydrolase [Brevibacillus fluminis]|uniref:Amidohydrolase n=2 Tax=Brevibacillus fluminis TaxID=511487 RepID=A0A3M8DJE0_9BACL|nr:amidohydrolase [Brevibacillus fluminis]
MENGVAAGKSLPNEDRARKTTYDDRFIATAGNLFQKLVNWRRDFHRHPEVGWTEFRTAAIIAAELSALGFAVRAGREVVEPGARTGVPHPDSMLAAKKRALQLGAEPAWVEKLEDGLTGVVGVWETGRPGPTVAFRFDIDALPIREADTATHVPYRQGYASRIDGVMHACGHDGHAAIGLGLATWIAEGVDGLTGTVKLIFQPAEEGSRGAKAMVAAGILDEVDYLLSGHIGLMATRQNQVVCGVTDFFASLKWDVRFDGVAAHAGFAPHEGRNALLAAATAAVQLHAIARHSSGVSRINVGRLEGGESRNAIASHALLQLELRATTNEVLGYLETEAGRIIHAAAQMYGVHAEITLVGESIAAPCDPALLDIVEACARDEELATNVVRTLPFNASEDITYMMEAVQKRGSLATYMLFGTELAAGHHNAAFDFREETMPLAVNLYGRVLKRISAKT